MRSRQHLLVAIHDRSWGRAEMAVRVAQELRVAGDRPRVLLHNSMVPLMQDTGFEIQRVDDHMGGLVRLALDSLVRQVQPDSLIFFDYFNTCNYLLGLGIEDASFLLEYPCTIASLDTWDTTLTGIRFDLFGRSEGRLALGDVEAQGEEFDRIVHRLIPVPITPIDDRPGKFACLPALSPRPLSGAEPARGGWARRLGIPDSHKTVLFCSSAWQQLRGDHESGRRIVRLLSRLMGAYLDRLGPTVHLVHVGPQSYPLQSVLGHRYHWQSPLGRAAFQELVARSDLLLSANVSATTIGWAIQMGVPVVVLENSRMLRSMDEVESVADGPLSEAAHALLREALPVYPFRLWPLGYYAFLQPLLVDNAYCQTFETVEVVNEPGVVSTCAALLFDPAARAAQARRQCRYIEQVKTLPSAAEVIRGFFA
jgi:hypothetical protein